MVNSNHKSKGLTLLDELDAIPVPENIINKVRNRLELIKEKGYRIVLSLAGGAAKGVVGNTVVLYFLDKFDLMKYFDEIWGVSAGAMIGGAYAAGLSVSELLDIVSSIRIRDFIPLPGMMPFPTYKIHDFFEKRLPVKTFDECRIPLYILATEYSEESQKIHVFKEGPIADAITASISIPFLFKPFEKDGKIYLDGGLVENTPNKSVLRVHYDPENPSKISIISTGFGKASLNLGEHNILTQLNNMLAYFRYRLQLEQNDCVRNNKSVYQLMLNFDIKGITKMQFNKMGPEIVPTYGQLLDKLSYICEKDAWNIDY